VRALVLVFDVEGPMALFRKPYTTTSMVSFPFPPPTALAGLMAAIVGINHSASKNGFNAAFWNEVIGTRVAIQIMKPIKWMQTAVNLTNVKEPEKAPHIRCNQQLLKYPCYRVYVSGGHIYDELRQRLVTGEFIYTPYLGVAYALADIKFIGEFEETIDSEGTEVNTIVPLYPGVEIDLLNTGAVHREIVPYRFSESRRIVETVNVIYTEPVEGKYSIIRLKQRGPLYISRVGQEKVGWFDAW